MSPNIPRNKVDMDSWKGEYEGAPTPGGRYTPERGSSTGENAATYKDFGLRSNNKGYEACIPWIKTKFHYMFIEKYIL